MRYLTLAVPAFALFACQSTTRVVANDARPATSSATPAPTPAASVPKERPTNKAGCDACNGKWAVHGISEQESCICKTRDGGKTCRDGSECEGACIVADDAKFEVAKPGNPPLGSFSGRCADYDTTFGCYRVIPKGKMAKGPVAAEEAAPRLCVD